MPANGHRNGRAISKDRRLFFTKTSPSEKHLQNSLDSAGFDGANIGYGEVRLYHFQETIDRLVGADNIPEAMRITPVLDNRWMFPNDLESRRRWAADEPETAVV